MSGKNVETYIVLDTETGGLNPIYNPITEVALAVLHPDTLSEVTRFQTYVFTDNPIILSEEDFKTISKKPTSKASQEEIDAFNVKIPKNCYKGGYLVQEAIESTGISPEKIAKKGKNVETVVNTLIGIFESVKITKSSFSKPILVGHNVMFDVDMLKYMFSICKEDLSKYIAGSHSYDGAWHPLVVDTIIEAKKYDSCMNSYNLRAVAESMNIELVNAHSAMTDVVTTIEVFKKTVFNMRSGEGAKKEARFRDTFQI